MEPLMITVPFQDAGKDDRDYPSYSLDSVSTSCHSATLYRCTMLLSDTTDQGSIVGQV